MSDISTTAEITRNVKTHHEFSIEAPFTNSVTSHDLMQLLVIAEDECRRLTGVFDSEPLPPGSVTVHFRNGRYTASFEVSQ